MPKPQSPVLHVRVDATLHDALQASAKAAGLGVNELVRVALRSAADRRARIALALGLPVGASDAEIVAGVDAALRTPLSAVELEHLPADPAAAVSYAVGRAAKRSKGGGKPAPSPSGKPTPAPGTKPPGQRASAAPAARTTAPAKALVSWKEYDALLALRAKRAGTPAPPKGASGACATVWVHATDAELAAVRGGK